jgi:hypothetical protein
LNRSEKHIKLISYLGFDPTGQTTQLNANHANAQKATGPRTVPLPSPSPAKMSVVLAAALPEPEVSLSLGYNSDYPTLPGGKA